MSNKKPKQDQTEINQMAAFYQGRHAQVWLLRCLKCGRVIGVEVEGHQSDALNTDRGRGFYNYKGLTLSIRRRLDGTPQNERMIGYQCACGNDTTIAQVERGDVPQSTTLINDRTGEVVSQGEPLPSLSPFEQSQLESTVRIKQAQGKKADYENSGDIERFESFQLERVK